MPDNLLKTEIGAGVPERSAVAHEAASLTSRELASWNPRQTSADGALMPELGVLRRRTRDMVRNNSIASGVVQTLTDNVVGRGLRLMARPDYAALGRDREWAADWTRRVERLWNDWAGDPLEADRAETDTFHGLTGQVLRGRLEDGESLALPIWRKVRGREATRLQLIDPDRLSNPSGEMDSPTLRGGIKIDAGGAPVGYHIRQVHPADVGLGFSQDLYRWKYVPARTPWGRPRVIHPFHKERTGQHRGRPLFTAVLTDFRMLDRYQRTELQSAIAAAMIAAFIKSNMDQESILNLFSEDPREAAEEYWSARNQHQIRLQGGAVIPLFPGEEIQAFNPSRQSSASYSAYVEGCFRQISAGLNIPYELLLKDFSKTNYSSARAAMLEAWRYILGVRGWLIDYWCRPVYLLKLEEWVNLGLVEAPGFYDSQAAYAKAQWVGPGRGWVDPVKESQAAQIRMDSGLSTLAAECAEQGLDWEEVLEQRAFERQRMKELDLWGAAETSAQRPVINTTDETEEQGGGNASSGAPAN